jgi:hypothetical protein
MFEWLPEKPTRFGFSEENITLTSGKIPTSVTNPSAHRMLAVQITRGLSIR